MTGSQAMYSFYPIETKKIIQFSKSFKTNNHEKISFNNF